MFDYDHELTTEYIPKLSLEPNTPSCLKQSFHNLESRPFQEWWSVESSFLNHNLIKTIFQEIGFDFYFGSLIKFVLDLSSSFIDNLDSYITRIKLCLFTSQFKTKISLLLLTNLLVFLNFRIMDNVPKWKDGLSKPSLVIDTSMARIIPSYPLQMK